MFEFRFATFITTSCPAIVRPAQTVTTRVSACPNSVEMVLIYMKNIFSLIILLSLITAAVYGQTADRNITFEKIELFQPEGRSVREYDVRVELTEDAMQIVPAKGSGPAKRFAYADIRSAEYSYTKNPRWKTGLGLGAAGVLFPPLWLVAIPLGFTKHRRHWVTIRTDTDFAVLKLAKNNRKLFIPAFETKSKVEIEALGDDK